MDENTKGGYVVEENDRSEDISGQPQHGKDTIFGSHSSQGAWSPDLHTKMEAPVDSGMVLPILRMKNVLQQKWKIYK